MSFTCKSIKMIAQCLIGMMIVSAWLISTCPAAEHGAGIKANATIHQMKPFRTRTVNANVLPQDVFDVVGTLNAIDGNQITIGDQRLTLTSNVSASGIAKWSEVGATLNQAGEVVAIEIISVEPH